MRRTLALCAGFCLLVSGVRGEDIAPDTVVAVKKATAFVRVQGKNWKGTGSGFVVAATKDSVLVATNYHVVAGPDADLRLTPAELVRSFKQVKVTTVFDGGTKTEVAANADVIAADPDNDLAVLRVTGLKAPPTPIAPDAPAKPVETMTVYSFGYPFGQALAVGKASPAITVGKASVSSLRLDDDGELALVQIDGALNPGNSGGPMVDAKGRLVGVAVSRIRDGQGIGFAVPAAELDRLMKGRAGGFHMTANKAADGKLTVKAEIGLLDPAAALKGATLHYVVVPPKGAKPKAGEPLEKHADAKRVALKLADGIGTAELTLPGASGDIVVQVVPDGVPGGASKVRSYSLAAPRGNDGVVLGGAAGAGEIDPPAGWKEYTPANKLYKVWVPEKSRGQSDKSSTSARPPAILTFNMLVVETTGGATFAVEQVLISPPPTNADRDHLTRLLRDVAVGDLPGVKTVREGDARMGRFPGKEYVVDRGATVTRARAFVIGSSLYLLRVVGTRDQAGGADATTFLDSCRLQVPNAPVGPDAGPPKATAGGPPGGHAFIQGGRNNPEFKDAVPAGAVLAGLEIGPGKVGDRATVRALRAVFRAGEKESYGDWRGAAPADADKLRVVAKPGYAVGAITVRTSLGVDGLQVTFMRATDGKLDPKDSYDSDWVGSKAGFEPVKLGGHGEAALGLIGKANENVVNGLGLLYKETK